MIDTGLESKVVLVTGANHGMGAATAVAMAKQGARVFINYLRLLSEEYGGIDKKSAASVSEPGREYYYNILMKSAGDVVQHIKESGGECFAWEGDLANPENIPRLFDMAEKQFGPVEIVVNNAAFDKCDTFIPPEELKKSPLFVNAYPMQTITAESHDENFAVNSRAAATGCEV